MNPKYSVVIPVYKAEKTIRRCVDSLISQNRPDVEILLVDDGSPDGSGEICRRYAEAYPQICCIQKENGGVSSARNCGLDALHGEYVTFVDSDDYVAPDYFAAMDSLLKDVSWDYIQLSKYFENKNEQTANHYQSAQYLGRDRLGPAIISAICNTQINSPCAKVYKRSIIEAFSIRFLENVSVGEDRAFNISYSLHIGSYCVSGHPVYHISTDNPDSLSRGRQDQPKMQFEITDAYIRTAVRQSLLSEKEKEQYLAAQNFSMCRGIYKWAKDLHRDRIAFFARLRTIRGLCREINQCGYAYPATRYCRLVTLPIRWELALVIDVMAWKLMH